MLSKKMAFSLTSLITILALAFVAPAAMAADDFNADFSVVNTVRGTDIEVTLTFGEAVGLTNVQAATVNILITDVNGLVAATALTGTAAVDSIGPVVAKDTNLALAGVQTDGKTFTFTIPAASTAVADPGPATRSIYMFIAAGVETQALGDDKSSKKGETTLTLMEAIAANTSRPQVVSIQRLRPGSQSVVAAFQEAEVTGAFDVRIVLTEKAFKPGTGDAINAADIEVANGTASAWTVGVPFARSFLGTDAGNTLRPHPSEGMYEYIDAVAPTLGLPTLTGTPTDFVPMPTGLDSMYHQYRVTITPHRRVNEVKISLKEFHDNASPFPNTYKPFNIGSKPNGREQLRLKVAKVSDPLTAGYKVTIPKDWIIPANGYLVIAQNVAGSEIFAGPGPAGAWRTNDTPRNTHRTPAQLLYNVIGVDSLPNLATAFQNGVVVDVQSRHPLVVTEVMWGEDVSLDPSSNSQYIELYNAGAQYKTVADDVATPDINEALTLIFYGPNEFASVPAKTAAVAATATAAAVPAALPAGITDRIGTLDAKGAYWNPASKGQSGRSGTTATGTAAERGAFVPVVEIISMYRDMVPSTAAGALATDMMVADGQMANSWMSSAGPKSTNFDPLAIGIRHGTPGAATDATDTPADTEAEAKAKADAAAAAAKKTASTGTIPTAGPIYISEIMVAGGGVLPQWIEIANGSATEDVNLSGWTLKVDNAAADADVSVGASVTFTIPDGTMIYRSRQIESPSTILVVTEAGRNNIDTASDQVVVLNAAGSTTEIALINAGVTKRKYTLLSSDAFLITLAPPAGTPTKLAATATAAEKAAAKAADARDAAMRKEATDMAGNLGADGAAGWALPMSDEGRSSIIRKHVNVNIGPSEPEDGMMMENWVLASDTAFAQATHIRTATYYGAMNDVGTPGFRAGGALPVELSHFRPARNKETGQVVITWSTQSELNNAGFFIKRSQQKDGEFKVINATMVPGAGTTSEKQFYTYTDTTAQPNVVYYYQIEDVSLDGNRQTLTRGIRLKGHVSVAGKATLTWGELKMSNE